MYKSLADAIRDAEASGRTLVADGARARERRIRGARSRTFARALRRALDGDARRGGARARRAICARRRGSSAATRALVARSHAGPMAGTLFSDVLARALAVQEVNAAMGVIVAAPTAGGAGVLPAVLTGLARDREIGDEAVIDALATAGLIGAVVAERASLSGAEGGCQAETGAAAGMAAGAATEMLGGTPSQVGPRRRAHDAGHARPRLRSARRARRAAVRLSQRHRLRARARGHRDGARRHPVRDPVDEVIDVMGEIGRNMDVRYRETAGGGLAATPTGRRLAKERLVQIRTAPR